MDSAALFTMLFGSDKLDPLIGELKIATFMSAQDDYDSRFTPKLQEFKQHRREVQCAVNLADRLSLFVDGSQERFEEAQRAEAHDLASAPFGGPVLWAIAYVYIEQASKFLEDPISGSLHSMKASVRTASHKYRALKSGWKAYKEATKMKDEAASSASKDNPTGEGEMAASNRQGAKLMEVMLEALWQANVLDIEETLREVCHKVLYDHSVDKPTRKRRAQGLLLLGKIFKECGKSQESAMEQLKMQFSGQMGGDHGGNGWDGASTARSHTGGGEERPTELGEGCHVVLKGLKSAEYNDHVGVVVGPAEDGRFPVVLLESNKIIRIKPENMAVI
eukprot:c3643_g1_i1.p1 GENE.c3643_g1_i1~~c3643_g1_i1.p1  ORF type:complete len:334 (-),score=69.11 c3643_g1_i1:181-1182(-)